MGKNSRPFFIRSKRAKSLYGAKWAFIGATIASGVFLFSNIQVNQRKVDDALGEKKQAQYQTSQLRTDTSNLRNQIQDLEAISLGYQDRIEALRQDSMELVKKEEELGYTLRVYDNTKRALESCRSSLESGLYEKLD